MMFFWLEWGNIKKLKNLDIIIFIGSQTITNYNKLQQTTTNYNKLQQTITNYNKL